jgi:hypothetical protein
VSLVVGGWPELAGALLPLPGLAHGIGGRQDLPVPLELFVVGSGVVLVVSFVALAVLWPEPRLQDPPAGHPVRGRWLGPLARILGALGAAGLALVVVAGLVGPPSSQHNPASVLVFVVFWLVVPFVSAVVGDVYPAIDPWRPVRALFGVDQSAASPSSLYPAVLGLLAFTWLELVSPWQEPRHLAIAAVVYTAWLVLWALRGRRSADVDAFAVYNRLLGRIGLFGRDETGGVARHGWFRALPHVPEQRGLALFVLAMIDTVTYDGASFTDWWSAGVELPLSRALFDAGAGTTAAGLAARTVGFLAVNLLLVAAYAGASWVAARLGGAGSTGSVMRRFAHSLVPIAFAYAFAHYFTLVLFEGQLLLSTMSDPFGLGWDLFGTADRAIDYSLITGSAVWVWYVQVAVIVIGHVAGVVLAHDRALADFDGLRAIRSQYAMLVLMVALTGLGLVMLAAG